jgi:preprotein translocase subunit YajC
MGVRTTTGDNLVRLPMAPLIVLAATFVLLWVLFILPQQRRVRSHQALVASLRPGDEVVLSAGIYGRIVELDAEEITLAVAPGVELRVARQAVLRRVEDAVGPDEGEGDDETPAVQSDAPSAMIDESSPAPGADPGPGTEPRCGGAALDPDERGQDAPGKNV